MSPTIISMKTFDLTKMRRSKILCSDNEAPRHCSQFRGSALVFVALSSFDWSAVLTGRLGNLVRKFILFAGCFVAILFAITNL